MGFRDYDPTTGRFASNDQLGLQEGQANLYTYVRNNPISFIDPQGLVPVGTVIGVITIGVGVVLVAAPGHPLQKVVGALLIILGGELITLYGAHAAIPPSNTTNSNTSQSVNSMDPNSKVGPAGYGPSDFVVPGATFPYRIDFENDPKATAPTQRVDITDHLDSNLDWNTFQLSGFGFGDTNIDIPTGGQHYETALPMTYNGQTFQVMVQLDFNAQTGTFHAAFQSIDPTTDLPPDVLTGFLPPEDGTGRGDGYVSYSIQAKTGLEPVIDLCAAAHTS
jgi:hypothetical protein